MPEFLTRRLGPLATWQWGLVAVGGVLALRWWRARQAAAAASSGTAANTSQISATVPDIPTESVTTPSGFSYSGPAGGASYYIPQGAMSATNGSPSGAPVAYTPPTGLPHIGGGYGGPGSGGYVTSASGSQFAQVPGGAALTGQQYYYQPEPGVFSALPQNQFGGTPPAPGGPSTPWFQLVGSSA